jgi:hypothetical protein
MNELKETKLARPLDKSVLSNDSATLRALTGMLNNPAITGAVVEKEERYDAPAGKGGATIPPSGVGPAETISAATTFPAAAPLAPPAPVAPPKIGNRLLFTGRSVTGLAAGIGAKLFIIGAPAAELAQMFFGSTWRVVAPGAENFLATIKAWGSAEVSEKFPLTPARATFITMIRSMANSKLMPEGINWGTFGSNEGFWIDVAVASAAEAASNSRVILSGISSKIEFDYFRAKGFQHWHIMGKPGAPAINELATALDNDVTKQISVTRSGAKLRCIWAENAPAPSERFWRLNEFVSAAGGAKPPEPIEANLSDE